MIFFLQLQELLDGTDAILDMCSPELKVVLQELQQEVVESWESLRMHMEQREEELQSAKDRYMFLNTVAYTQFIVHFLKKILNSEVSFGGNEKILFENYFITILYCLVPQAQDYSLWCSQVLSGMKAEESIRDVSTCDLQLLQHQQLWAEIVAHEETYAQAMSMGQDQLEHDIPNAKEVRTSVCLVYTRTLQTDVRDNNISTEYIPNTCLNVWPSGPRETESSARRERDTF